MPASLFQGVAFAVNGQIEKDMAYSRLAMNKAEPIIRMMFDSINISVVRIEGKEEEACQILDNNCGIDYFVVYPKTGKTFGVAWRAQPDDSRHWETFTVRKKRKSGAPTELEKRRNAIQCGSLYPHYVMQAYTHPKTGEVIRMAVTTTKDIIEFIDNSSPVVRKTGSDKIGQAEFYVLPWIDMRLLGYNILTFDKSIGIA